MPVYTSTSGVSGVLPPDYADLVIRPFVAGSVAAAVSTVKRTARHDYRIPVVAEGAELAVSELTVSEMEQKFSWRRIAPTSAG